MDLLQVLRKEHHNASENVKAALAKDDRESTAFWAGVAIAYHAALTLHEIHRGEVVCLRRIA